MIALIAANCVEVRAQNPGGDPTNHYTRKRCCYWLFGCCRARTACRNADRSERRSIRQADHRRTAGDAADFRSDADVWPGRCALHQGPKAPRRFRRANRAGLRRCARRRPPAARYRSPQGEPVPNIYATATSAYGLYIEAEQASGATGLPKRVKTGGPGVTWMHGMFGTALGGGPGSIWKFDGRTGKVSLFANVTLNGVSDRGPALGAIAFDPASRRLFVSDLQRA